MADRAVRVLCRAKLNLVLEITGKRPDGYHDLATVMHPIDLCDEVCLRIGKPGLRLATSGWPSPEGESNIAYRAARAFYGLVGSQPSLEVHLHKRIPDQGGLGGGSADAAGVLAGLAWLHGWAPQDGRLLLIAARLGADIPFFLASGPALAEGIGDRLTPLPALRFACVLALGRPGVNTGWAYSQIAPAHLTDGSRAAWAADRLRVGCLAEPWNVFAEALAPLRPDLRALLERMTALTGAPAGLTGSGACVFGLPADGETAQTATDALAAEGLWTWCGESADRPLTLEEDL